MDKLVLPKNIKDLRGLKFGKLTVLSFSQVSRKKACWFCLCECGGTKTTTGSALQNNCGTHCGCVPKRHGSRLKDMVGKRIGTLTILSRSVDKPRGRLEAYWTCQCDCGAKSNRSGNTLRKGACFCRYCQKMGTNPVKDLRGKRFGHLLVLELGGRTKTNRVLWVCKCDCGHIKEMQGGCLTAGDSVTCGCGQLVYPGLSGIVHGETRGNRSTPRYQMWANARARAKKQNIPFTITLEDIVYTETCPLLGTVLLSSKGRGPTSRSPTLDQIVPGKGYVKGNVWVISHRANTIKNDASIQEIERIAQNLRRKVDELNGDTSEDQQSSQPLRTSSYRTEHTLPSSREDGVFLPA